MKLITLHLIFITSFFLVNGCDKPAPTELKQEEDQLEVEVITRDTGDDFYSSGYDTTGIIYNPSHSAANIINVSGIKTTFWNATISSSYAQAVFFNKDFPVLSPDGRLIGYETRVLGNVDFNRKRARLIPFRIRFKNRINGLLSDTTLGFKHVLHYKPSNHDDDFNFQYNSLVNFNLNIIDNIINFNIPTESEINGQVRLERKRNNLTVRLNWNAELSENFEIIVGGSLRTNGKIFPIYRIRTRDDGNLEIPWRLLNQIPLNRFERLIFSVIRKKEFRIENNNNELFILSQSIHNLVVNIP